MSLKKTKLYSNINIYYNCNTIDIMTVTGFLIEWRYNLKNSGKLLSDKLGSDGVTKRTIPNYLRTFYGFRISMCINTHQRHNDSSKSVGIVVFRNS